MISIIDYGLGNLKSVYKALKSLGFTSKITSSIKDIDNCNGIIFPGVGSFGDCMKQLDDRGLINSLKKSISSGKPFMGICLGLQILFERSEESPNVEGLSILKGEISKIKFDKDLKVPHMGWNKINIIKNSKILQGINSDTWMYFVHSFKLNNDLKITDSVSSYGEIFSASINKDNIFATQFHPEKSSKIGLTILKNFADLCN
ncbi:MAG: imidazole glycerol phosphate synthase subunit HisH [Thermodesulfobacteriota bacterium]|jgi:glutamine amidotransferase|nr:imidazole glycerol phosphate synthase subunit HisH [Candidatus Dadabacteria bacterium]|tara:strand:- start:7312 stop:7920 length:609 start_codon:yes stop_codon:yes gene_type:complete